MTQVAKQMTLLIFIAVALVVACVGFFFADGSLAWFSENESATAGGLSLKAKISPNLIIADSVDELVDGTLDFSVDFNGMGRSDMVAVTRDETIEGTRLKYLTNHHAVDTMTGKKKDGMELEFAAVPVTDNEQYFIDYVVYIASAFDPLEVSSLSARVVMPEADDLHPYFNAVSVAFYIGEVNDEGYRGTTSVSDSKHNPENAKIELLPGGDTIPLNTSDHIKVTMRCYFDGALEDPDTGIAYVNSYTVKSDRAVVGVEFLAIDAESAE